MIQISKLPLRNLIMPLKSRLLTIWLFLIFPSCSVPIQENVDWPVYLGDAHSSQFSNLQQINRQNVTSLRVAWTYSTGDASLEDRSEIQCNPIIIDGVLYGSSAASKFFALNAITGDMLWTFDPLEGDRTSPGRKVNRGVAWWGKGSQTRILAGFSHWLFSIDAKTGKLDPDFGQSGVVDLRKGLETKEIEWDQVFVDARTPGIVFEDLLILGSRVGESYRAAPGHVRAFNILTGKIAWTFHTIPQPGEFGAETWGPKPSDHNGGANSWAGLSLDKERGVVYIPTGSATPDFFGGNRKGANLFANCILALDARTGERLWHFQTVHHDLWDRDLPAPPNLVTVVHQGQTIDAVAQITKSGHVVLLDRDTGKPLFPVKEKPVPSSDVHGEESFPTQPLPTAPPPFSRQSFTPTNLSGQANKEVRNAVSKLRKDGIFAPPSTQGTLVYPGFDGGGEWGGAAVNPEEGILYVNSQELAWIITLFEIDPKAQSEKDLSQINYLRRCASCHGLDHTGGSYMGEIPNLKNLDRKFSLSEIAQIIRNGKGSMPPFGWLPENQIMGLARSLLSLKQNLDNRPTQPNRKSSVDIPIYGHTGYNRFYDADGYPANAPPWGNLTAIDLNVGQILWQVPLGEYKELTAQGIPQTGTANYGGPILTAGGLIFIAASLDEKFRAFDAETGKVVWETQLPAAGFATPATYAVNNKQYIVIASGGGKLGRPSGDTYIAYSLP